MATQAAITSSYRSRTGVRASSSKRGGLPIMAYLMISAQPQRYSSSVSVPRQSVSQSTSRGW